MRLTSIRCLEGWLAARLGVAGGLEGDVGGAGLGEGGGAEVEVGGACGCGCWGTCEGTIGAGAGQEGSVFPLDAQVGRVGCLRAMSEKVSLWWSSIEGGSVGGSPNTG